MKTTRNMMTVVMVMAVMGLAAGTANAATVTVSGTAPVVDGEDIAVLTTPGSHTDKWWSDTTNHGQTFTTGSNDVILNAFTLQTSSPGPATKTYSVRIGEVSGSSFTTISMETGSQTAGMIANDYITFTLDTPIPLSANTVYGFDAEMTGSTTGWQSGIPYIWYHRSDLVAGGSRYTRNDGDPATISLSSGWDRVFHVDLETAAAPIPEPATMCALGMAIAGLGGYVRKRRRA